MVITDKNEKPIPKLNLSKDVLANKDGEEDLRKSTIEKSKKLLKKHGAMPPREDGKEQQEPKKESPVRESIKRFRKEQSPPPPGRDSLNVVRTKRKHNCNFTTHDPPDLIKQPRKKSEPETKIIYKTIEVPAQGGKVDTSLIDELKKSQNII